MEKLSTYAVFSLVLGLVLLAVVGCNNNQNTPGEQTDEQTAAGYIEELGYTIVVSEGETSRYTLEEIKGMEREFTSENLSELLE
ncbi:hypothetical protein MKX42_24065 [Paenibacillus sp. FSL R7-0204]|uniref:hypothetical protein n=1 Tax=Paenibacillus sp. FSL R7-0204 TaxID=2921675 RepID=UPI0030F50372